MKAEDFCKVLEKIVNYDPSALVATDENFKITIYTSAKLNYEEKTWMNKLGWREYYSAWTYLDLL